MKLNKVIAIPALALTAGLSLAACGSVKAPAAAPAVTHTVTAAPAASAPTTVAPTSPAPKVVIVTSAPAKTVYAQAPAPAAPALTDCGTGVNGAHSMNDQVYAGANTSCAFALNVQQAYVDGGYWYQAGTSQFYAYSPVTGQSYLMTSSSVGEPVVVTGGNGALVQFHF